MRVACAHGRVRGVCVDRALSRVCVCVCALRKRACVRVCAGVCVRVHVCQGLFARVHSRQRTRGHHPGVCACPARTRERAGVRAHAHARVAGGLWGLGAPQHMATPHAGLFLPVAWRLRLCVCVCACVCVCVCLCVCVRVRAPGPRR